MKLRPLGFLFALILLSGCAQTELASHVVKTVNPSPQTVHKGKFKVGAPYKIAGKRYVPKETYNHTETGVASWYGPNFHGKQTANGEIFNKNDLTAAHRTLQLPSLVRVTNLSNGRSIILRVNDRGPFSKGRVLDVSERAAELLDFKHKGTTRVKVEVLSKESQALTQAAKRGEDTRGIEIAMNENRLARSQGSARAQLPQQRPAPQQQRKIASNKITPNQASQPNLNTIEHIEREALPPAPRPVANAVNPALAPGQNIYVQAGSFGNEASARSVANALTRFGQAKVYPAIINGSQFYRVRIGPVADRRAASIVLANLENSGRSNAVIVVD